MSFIASSFLASCQMYDKVPSLIEDSKGIPMVLVPKGEFYFGIQENFENQDKQYLVALDAFYIDQYEITNANYIVCVKDGNCTPPIENSSFIQSNYYENPLFSNYPVTYITWYDAKAYCEWRDARLPTEAEWEKAARGEDQRIYPWGNTLSCEFANYGEVKEGCFPSPGTTPVGSFPKGQSPYGVYDLVGNVQEWVADCYMGTPDNYLEKETRNPYAPELLECNRVVHGGAFFMFGSAYAPISVRLGIPPEQANPTIGFRCAKTLK